MKLLRRKQMKTIRNQQRIRQVTWNERLPFQNKTGSEAFTVVPDITINTIQYLGHSFAKKNEHFNTVFLLFAYLGTCLSTCCRWSPTTTFYWPNSVLSTPEVLPTSTGYTNRWVSEASRPVVASCIAASVSDDHSDCGRMLSFKCGLPSLEECRASAEAAVCEGDVFSAVKFHLLSSEPENALPMGIDYVKGTGPNDKSIQYVSDSCIPGVTQARQVDL